MLLEREREREKEKEDREKVIIKIGVSGRFIE